MKRDSKGRFVKSDEAASVVGKPSKPKPSKPKPKPSKPKPKPKPSKSKPSKPKKPVYRDKLGRFVHKKTTAEFREAFYKPVSKRRLKGFEKRGELSPQDALALIRELVEQVFNGYREEGLFAIPRAQLNFDKTVDGEVLVPCADRMVFADSQEDEARKLLHRIPNFIDEIDDTIWFSIRLDFQTVEPVDRYGDAFNYEELDIYSAEQQEELSASRWKTKVLQTSWQHTRSRLYSNVEGANAIVVNTLRRNADFKPILTSFAFKLGWNPWNIAPGRTR